MEIEKEKSKILIMGLDNAGKTSIILSLQCDTNILSYFKLKPTRGIKRINFEDFSKHYHIWDFGGQEQFRNEYLDDLKEYLIDSKKLTKCFHYLLSNLDQLRNFDVLQS